MALKVRDMIALLQTMPQDAVVLRVRDARGPAVQFEELGDFLQRETVHASSSSLAQGIYWEHREGRSEGEPLEAVIL